MIRPRLATTALLLLSSLSIGQNLDPQQRSRKEQGAPLPLDRSAQAMTLPPGFQATLFAGEPDVHQPIAFCIDYRGRLWVAENDSYPQWEEHGKDRIVIFEDTDGDGRFDRRTVFAEGFHYITGVQVGMGGVWVLDSPNLLFFPMHPGEDKPAGKSIPHLEGWSWRGIHNVPNSLTWGPDGWLYGCSGISGESLIKVAGAPDDPGVRINCGIWRYHPVRKIFERHAEGTTNPWGIDYDPHGQMFMSNNVVPHLWHIIQGAHYRRMHGRDFSPYVFEQIQTCADHLHWGGGDWTASRGGEGIHDAAGGGHSHAGLLLYQGTTFPPEYRGTLFMCNTHGHRLNNDSLAPRGSGFVASHRPDFCLANDKWFKGVAVHEGPDGSIYFIDWSDTGECHDYDITDRDHARIYRVAWKDTPRVTIDLEKQADLDLARMQAAGGEWFARRARLVLRDRNIAGKLAGEAKTAIVSSFETDADPIHRLRSMWTLWNCGLLDEPRALRALADPDPYLRAWAIQFLCEDCRPSARALEKLEALARNDASPVVRLYLASALQRTPPNQRWPILQHLVTRAEDAADPNLPCMYWYALEPLIGADPGFAAGTVIPMVKIPRLRELTARRLVVR